MKMTKQKWIGVALAVAIFLAAFGVALATVLVQVSRGVPTTLTTAQVLADENLGLYHNADGTGPVVSLDIPLLRPPLGGSRVTKIIYVRNESDIDLTLIEPCRNVFDEHSDSRLGHIEVRMFNLNGSHRGWICEKNVTLAPDEMVLAELRFDAVPDLAPGEYSFTTVFGAVGETDAAGPGTITDDFGDGQIDERWTVLGGSPTEAVGQLTITIDDVFGGASQRDGLSLPSSAFGLESFGTDVTVDGVMDIGGSDLSVQHSFAIAFNQNFSVNLPGIATACQCNGSDMQVSGSDVVTLRLVKVGEIVEGFISRDGGPFVATDVGNTHEGNFTLAGEVTSVALGIDGFMGNSSGSYKIDSFSLTGPSVPNVEVGAP